MNSFPLLVACTICLSLAVLRTSFEDLREAPLRLDAPIESHVKADLIRLDGLPSRSKPVDRPASGGANEGLLDHELASTDPIQAWLDRYLTPAKQETKEE